MKYIIRFICATIIWPFLIVYIMLSWFVFNTLSILWNFNFKHLWVLEKKDFYFYIQRNGLELSDIDIKNNVCNWRSYTKYYATPLDMIRGNITKTKRI